MRVLAATTRPARLGDDLLGLFGTRIALQAFDDEQSVLLLGRPDAADLGAGDLFLRVDRRMPLRARGFRIAPEHLEQLVALMREAYGARPVPPAATPGRSSRTSPARARAGEPELPAPVERRRKSHLVGPSTAAEEPPGDGRAGALEPVRDDVDAYRETAPSVGCRRIEAGDSRYEPEWERVVSEAMGPPGANGHGPHPNEAEAGRRRSADPSVGEADGEADRPSRS